MSAVTTHRLRLAPGADARRDDADFCRARPSCRSIYLLEFNGFLRIALIRRPMMPIRRFAMMPSLAARDFYARQPPALVRSFLRYPQARFGCIHAMPILARQPYRRVFAAAADHFTDLPK